jgi:hypothetical protein
VGPSMIPSAVGVVGVWPSSWTARNHALALGPHGGSRVADVGSPGWPACSTSRRHMESLGEADSSGDGGMGRRRFLALEFDE